MVKRAKSRKSKTAKPRTKKGPPKPPAPGALVVTIDQAATMLAIGRVSVYKMIREHRLDAPMFGRARRITRASIDRLISGEGGAHA